jgi:carboxypeptidase Taq
MTASQAYEQLIREMREIGTLRTVGAILDWDEQTQMPATGAGLRADQASLIDRITHERFTSPRVGELLAAVESSDLVRDAESDAATNVREVRRDYDRATKLPSELVEEMSRTSVMAQQAWKEARKEKRFATFQPWLAKTVDLKRREAECIGYAGGHIYDPLLDSFEPYAMTPEIRDVFTSLRAPLVELIGQITSSGKKAPLEILERNYPAAQQERLARAGAEAVGFDFVSGRLDVAVHPFCSGIGPGDTRMTTRYDEKYFADAFFGTLHETGHGLYEQGLPKQGHVGEPIARSVSLGIHESQSRMWENLVGRSRSFWEFFWPRTQEAFGDTLRDVTFDQWLWAVNDVRPSFIRTEADEATYNLHTLIRFELEQALLTGDLNVPDAPGAWNERYQKYLGITPPDDARGVLQDVHWSAGLFGYFPTYTLGNLYAAQFFEAARRELGDLDAMFARGEFRPLLEWLRQNIHRHGKRYTAKQLVKRITGRELTAEPLLHHLRRKAAELYGV